MSSSAPANVRWLTDRCQTRLTLLMWALLHETVTLQRSFSALLAYVLQFSSPRLRSIPAITRSSATTSGLVQIPPGGERPPTSAACPGLAHSVPTAAAQDPCSLRVPLSRSAVGDQERQGPQTRIALRACLRRPATQDRSSQRRAPPTTRVDQQSARAPVAHEGGLRSTTAAQPLRPCQRRVGSAICAGCARHSRRRSCRECGTRGRRHLISRPLGIATPAALSRWTGRPSRRYLDFESLRRGRGCLACFALVRHAGSWGGLEKKGGFRRRFQDALGS